MNFSPESRAWIYLSDRNFSENEVSQINQLINEFCIEWTAHGANLEATGEVLHHRFIYLMVDETHAGASGCSIDTSVRFIKTIEEKFHCTLFNRLLFAWRDQSEIKVSHINDLQKLGDEGSITEETTIFDSLVATKKDFDERFETALGKSWMIKRVALPQIKDQIVHQP